VVVVQFESSPLAASRPICHDVTMLKIKGTEKIAKHLGHTARVYKDVEQRWVFVVDKGQPQNVPFDFKEEIWERNALSAAHNQIHNLEGSTAADCKDEPEWKPIKEDVNQAAARIVREATDRD